MKRNIKNYSKSGKKSPTLFNVDLHIGVIADLEQEIRRNSAQLTRWSISSSNHLLNNRLPVPDPVSYVNAKSWHRINDEIIDKFQLRYKKFLTSFDGFICTYSPVFAELYRGLNKPILIVAATRYETPYTDRQLDWSRFNSFLFDGVKDQKILLHANNKGDSDYISFFTGLEVNITPSLCKKSNIIEKHIGPRVILSRDKKLTKYIENQSNSVFKDIGILGSTYDWKDLSECTEVLIFPQNISTMTLFELATAGVPVAVPSRKWIHELIGDGFKLLGELTFHELLGLSTRRMPSNSPANYRSQEYLDWWLDRADFFNAQLMPNIRIVESLRDLLDFSRLCDSMELYNNTIQRNLVVEGKRKQMIFNFLNLL